VEGEVEQVRAEASGVRTLLKRLQKGGVVGILPDQQPKAGEGEFAPFFGKQALTMTLLGRLANRSGAQVLVRDALERKESCGGHFREESCTPEGEAKRHDANFSHVSVWEYQGEGREAALNREPLAFENVKIAERSYK
jgi:hypothetical protein